MTWVKLVGGLILMLIGVVWIGQGLNLIKGSVMTGQPIYALLGLVLFLVGGWLVWGFARSRRALTSADGPHV